MSIGYRFTKALGHTVLHGESLQRPSGHSKHVDHSMLLRYQKYRVSLSYVAFALPSLHCMSESKLMLMDYTHTTISGLSIPFGRPEQLPNEQRIYPLQQNSLPLILRSQRPLSLVLTLYGQL